MVDQNQADAFRITIPAVGQKEMRLAGPMIPASWYISEEAEAALRVAGMPITPAVEGHLLLDTGAAHIGIDSDVAIQLGLKGMKKATPVHGIKGYETMNHYMARLLLPVIPLRNNAPLASAPVAIGFPIEAWEITGIMEKYEKLGCEVKPGVPLRVIGILGRIFLQFTKLMYNGLNGTVDLHINKAAMYGRND
jgi:hypothetical protein